MKYYFPASGFGFWYQLGVLEKILEYDSELYGCSSGSIICLMSILKKKDRKFHIIANLSEKIKNSIYFINIYFYLDELIRELLKVINSYDKDFVEYKLSKIYIEMCQIKFHYGFPYLKKVIKNPKNLIELRNYIISSCYVPFFSYYKNPFYFKLDNSIYIDGFFGYSQNLPNNLKKINSYRFATLIPTDYKKSEKLYNLGLCHKFKKENENFNLITFIIISINIIIDLFLLLIETLIDCTHFFTESFLKK